MKLYHPTKGAKIQATKFNMKKVGKAPKAPSVKMGSLKFKSIKTPKAKAAKVKI